MNFQDFDFLCQLLKERSGLVMTRDKAYLVDSRLMPVARKYGKKEVEELILAIRSDHDETLIRDVTEAMITNESFFFRDIKPYDQFEKTVLPTLLERRANGRTLRIWSAACSSGQEPYSVAILLRENAQLFQGWRVEILATDISRKMLDKAVAGIYSQFEVQRGLPVKYLVKYFSQMGEYWQIDASLREMVEFREFNLLDDPVALGRFDVVFCRNVLIYFDNETKRLVLERIGHLMPEDGFLFLGGAETVIGVSERFQPALGQRGIYVPTPREVGFKQAAS